MDAEEPDDRAGGASGTRNSSRSGSSTGPDGGGIASRRVVTVGSETGYHSNDMAPSRNMPTTRPHLMSRTHSNPHSPHPLSPIEHHHSHRHHSLLQHPVGSPFLHSLDLPRSSLSNNNSPLSSPPLPPPDFNPVPGFPSVIGSEIRSPPHEAGGSGLGGSSSTESLGDVGSESDVSDLRLKGSPSSETDPTGRCNSSSPQSADSAVGEQRTIPPSTAQFHSRSQPQSLNVVARSIASNSASAGSTNASAHSSNSNSVQSSTSSGNVLPQSRSPSRRLGEARERFLDVVGRDRGGSVDSTGTAEAGDDDVQPGVEGAAENEESDEDGRRGFQASFNRQRSQPLNNVELADSLAEGIGQSTLKTPTQRAVKTDLASGGIVSPGSILNIPPLDKVDIPPLDMETEAEEGRQDLREVVASPVSLYDSAFNQQPPSLLAATATAPPLPQPTSTDLGTASPTATTSSLQGATSAAQGHGRRSSNASTQVQGSMLARWAAARDKRSSPPMIAGLVIGAQAGDSSPQGSLGRSGSGSSTAGSKPSGETAHLWDSVWPGTAPRAESMRPALNPPESVEVSSSPDVPIVSTDESPPPLIHHPYTYPPAQEQETSTSNVVAVSAATPGSPSLAPAMQSRSASHHGLLGSAVAASPPIGPAAVNMTSTPRTGGFSSPEGWAGRRAARSSPQSAGGDSRRARSPPVSPLWSGSGRRLTGGSSDEPALGRSPRGVSSDASGLSRRTSSGLSGRSSGSSRGSVAERMTPSETSTAGISRILNEESQFDATSLSPRTSEASPRGPSSRRPDQHELPPFSLPPSRGLPPNQTVRDEHIDRQDSGKPPEENADEPSADATTDVVPPPMQLGLEPLQPANIPKVEERSPSSIVAEGPSPRTEIDQDTVCDEVHGTGDRLPVTEFDEVMAAPKDVLPSDVAFEDEGLNTLERIFLLSKSDYPFHRAYVARMLGDLLDDVDPCETVEYVLPLLSGFAVDEDEMVKEAFAGEIHRIMWFFFSSCKIMTEDGGVIEESPPRSESPAAPVQVTTITSDGVSTVPRPSVSAQSSWEGAGFPVVLPGPSSATSRSSAASAQQRSSTVSTVGSGSTLASTPASSADTPVSVTSCRTTPDNTADDVSAKVNMETSAIEESLAEDTPPRPCIPVHVFTPLLGSMLLSQNSLVADPTRAAIVAIIAKIRGVEHAVIESWKDTRSAGDRRSYISQTGIHQHGVYPFSEHAKKAVEHELLEGLVLGMGRLDTGFADLPSELDRAQSAEMEGMTTEEAEAFKAQLSDEAIFGRAISMNLIASVAEFYPPDDLERLGFIDAVLAAGEDEAGVRTEAALALAYLAKAVPMPHFEHMLRLFHQFAKDENEQVRQSACLCLPALCKRIETYEDRRQFAVQSMQAFMNSTLAVQYTALEILGEVIHLFHTDPSGPPPELLGYYLDTRRITEGDDSETARATKSSSDEKIPPEVRHEDKPESLQSKAVGEEPGPELPPVYFEDLDRAVVAAYNFPSVCLTLGPSRWPDLRETYMALQRIEHPRIRRSLAASLHELALILGPAVTAADLLPFFYRSLEESAETREKVMANLPVFVANLHGSTSNSNDVREVKEAVELVEVLSKLWSDGFFSDWHEREVLAGQISRLLEVFVATASESQGNRGALRTDDEASVEDAANGSLELLRSGLMDTFAAVRDAAISIVPHCFEVVRNVQSLRNRLFLLLQELGANHSFKMRKTYIACIQALMDSPWSMASSPSLTNDRAEQRRSFFEEYFMEPLSIMCDDLLDVRIALSKLVANICSKDSIYAHGGSRPLPLSRMIDELLSDDSDYVLTPLRDISRTPPVISHTASIKAPPLRGEGYGGSDGAFIVIRNVDGGVSSRMRKARSEAPGMGMSRHNSDSTIKPASSPSDGSLLSPGSTQRSDDRGSRSAPAYVGVIAYSSAPSSARATPPSRHKGASGGKPRVEPSQVGMTDVFEKSFEEALTAK